MDCNYWMIAIIIYLFVFPFNLCSFRGYRRFTQCEMKDVYIQCGILLRMMLQLVMLSGLQLSCM